MALSVVSTPSTLLDDCERLLDWVLIAIRRLSTLVDDVTRLLDEV